VQYIERNSATINLKQLMKDSPTFFDVIIALVKLIVFPILSFQWLFWCERQNGRSEGFIFGLLGMIGLVLLGIIVLTYFEVNPGGKNWSAPTLFIATIIYLYTARQNLILITKLQDEQKV